MSGNLTTLCGANAKSTGKPCRRPSGWGTDHVGQGRCKLHGGATPIKSGRYSKVQRTRIRELYEQYQDDPDPLNVLPEIAAARGLFQDFIERYDEWRDAVIAWHASFSKEYQYAVIEANERELPPPDPAEFVNKPREVLDLSDGVAHLKTIAQIAQAEKKLQLDNAISRKDLLRVFTEQRRIVESETDTETARRILDGFRGIHLA